MIATHCLTSAYRHNAGAKGKSEMVKSFFIRLLYALIAKRCVQTVSTAPIQTR